MFACAWSVASPERIDEGVWTAHANSPAACAPLTIHLTTHSTPNTLCPHNPAPDLLVCTRYTMAQANDLLRELQSKIADLIGEVHRLPQDAKRKLFDLAAPAAGADFVAPARKLSRQDTA